jgi:hypothetical protein
MNGAHRKIRSFVYVSALLNLGGTILVLALGYVFVPTKIAENPWGKFRAGFEPPTWLFVGLLGAMVVLHLVAYLITRLRLRMEWKAYWVAILSTGFTACMLAPFAGAVLVDVYRSASGNMVPFIPCWFGTLIFAVPISSVIFFLIAGVVAILVRDGMDNSRPVG